MKKILMSISILTVVLALFSFSDFENKTFAHGKEKHGQRAGENEIAYTGQIKPLFERKCLKCHGQDSPVHMEFIKDVTRYKKKMKGPRMDSYTYLTSFIVWPDTGSLMKALDDGRNTENSKPGKMYKHLGKTEKKRQDTLKLIKEWVGNWTLKEWSDIKKEDITKMKLAY